MDALNRDKDSILTEEYKKEAKTLKVTDVISHLEAAPLEDVSSKTWLLRNGSDIDFQVPVLYSPPALVPIYRAVISTAISSLVSA